MNIPTDILEILKCSDCEEYLSRGPVYLRYDGAALCGQCYSPDQPAVRSKLYEATAQLLIFPCKNRNHGCKQTIPFAKGNEVCKHETTCNFRQYVCPVLGSSTCNWMGTRNGILDHCREQHGDRVLQNCCKLVHNITSSSLNNYILPAFDSLFILHIKVCIATGKIYHSIQILDSIDEAVKYKFSLDVIRNECLISRTGHVVPHGFLPLQDDTNLDLDINSLLNVLGGWEGTIFRVKVEQRLNQQAKQEQEKVEKKVEQRVEKKVEKNQEEEPLEKCLCCNENVTMMLYRDKNGWLCEQCIPPKKRCENSYLGCRYQDFENKCLKHELYFCGKGIECPICGYDWIVGRVNAHYNYAHKDITYDSGSTWNPIYTATRNWKKEYALVKYKGGIAVCEYVHNELVFELKIFINLHSGQLCKYTCLLAVFQEATGGKGRIIIHRDKPNALYGTKKDWYLKIKKEEFINDSELEVVVDITKISD